MHANPEKYELQGRNDRLFISRLKLVSNACLRAFESAKVPESCHLTAVPNNLEM
jgi:hypothetical protein